MQAAATLTPTKARNSSMSCAAIWRSRWAMRSTISKPETAFISRAPLRIAGKTPAAKKPGFCGSTHRQRFRYLKKNGLPVRQFLGGKMNWRFGVRVLPLLAGLLLVGSCAKKTPTLNLLVWEGYADPSFVQAFEAQNHCKVSASYMGTSDELVAKLRGGSAGNYDVISPSSDVATSIATAGLAAPLDLTKLPSYQQLSPKLRDMPLVKANGDIYGVPFMWGPNPLIYYTTAFPKAPDSWASLWDPRLQNKISVWDDLSTVYMAAQVLGYDK